MLFKKLRIFFLSILFFSLFISCENAISYDEDDIPDSITAEEVNTSGPEKYASISGYYQNNEGALPAGIQKAIAKNESAGSSFKNRSAYPGLNTTLNEIQYYVTATAENEKAVSGSVSVENKSYSVTGLKFGIDWTVEVGIKVKISAEGETENWVRCFYDVSEPVRITESNMAVSRNLILKPDTSGYGSVELNLTTDSSITGLEIKLDNEEQRSKWQTALAADSEKEISASKIKLANLQSGQYDLTLLFTRSGESYPCYSTTQTIVVIKGMKTDTWQSNGTSLISATGEFNLTSTLISNYVDSCIYVGPNSAASSINVRPDDSNEGRAYTPLASVNEAIKRIRNANVSRDYKIFVSGSHDENIKIGGEGADVLPGTAAASITIQGLNNNNAKDVLTAPQFSTAPCLSIQTDIPVILKNIKITTTQNTFDGTYSSSEKGGGLYIETSSSAPGVTLDSGVLIDGCIISGTGAKGAGIYLDSGKLTIKTGAKISNNQVINQKTLGIAEGGGIYINSGTVEICGGEISGNSVSLGGFSGIKAGGGIYIKEGGSLLLSGNFSMSSSGSAAYNDIYVETADSIKIKNAISPQAGTSGAMATITPAQDLQRGVSIVSLDSGSSLSSIAPYKDYFALSNNDWIIKANNAGNALVIDAPIYVAGQVTHPVTGKAGKAAANGGNGTKSAPYDNIEQAINAIIALNATENYTIYVDGEIIGLQTIPSSLTSSHASGITIQGASGNTSDILNRTGLGSGSGSVLTISSPVSVTIKDLKITGGNTTGNGGGINMISGSTVTLESGALIGGTSGSTAASDTEHSANYADKGGGIYSEGNLTLKNGSAVIYNYANDGGGICCNGGSLTIEAGAKVNLNGTNTTGGGITTKGTELSMTGGEVCNNISNSGVGGLYITKNSSDYCPALITISGAKISNNSADDGSSGGIYYSGGQTLAITGNTEVSGNHSKFEGGGIRVAPGVLDLSDCTISGNYSNEGNRPGGGIAASAYGSIKLSGSVYIPSGATKDGSPLTGDFCNDVCYHNASPIKIKGALTLPAECTDGIIATITPGTYIRGTAIIEAEGSVTDLTSYKDYFTLTNSENWNVTLSADKKQITLDAPIYVSTSGSSATTTTGTKNDPFRTIQDAISTALTDTNVDYTILIDGELRATTVNNNGTINGYAQEIIDPGEPAGSTIKAKSITIRGASASNGNPTDVINGLSADGTKTARGLFIGTKIPVTIENLKITGGLADEGGGIYLSGEDTTLTLGNDVLITGNKAKNSGGGIYLNKNTINNSCPTLYIKGNVKICDNTNSVSGDPSNLYLPAGKLVNVIGPLTNGSKKAQVGISTAAEPDAASTVTFTSGYGLYNYGVAPGTYFTGDKWTVAAGSDFEACLAASGGNITVDPIYEDIKISIDKSLVYLAEESKTFTFTASVKDSNGNNVTVSPGTGTGKVAYSYTVTYHGELLTSGTHFTPGDDVNLNTLTLSNSLPEGNYTINVVAIYNGNTYCAEFNVTLKEYLDVQGSDGTEISDSMRTSTAKYLKVKFTNDYGIKAPEIPESEKQSSGYYDSDMKLDYSCIIPAGKTLELTSDVPVTIKCNAVYYMFKVSGTLIIGENVKLTGTHLVPSERSIIHGHLINIYSGGKVILDGGTITNGVGAGSISSHAIEIQNRGTLIINSGYITNGNGGGGAVQVNSGGKVEMYGGEISDNIARGGKTGGVTVRNNGTFIKSGGIIKNNTLSGNPSQLYVFAGGKYGTSENNLVTYSEDYEVTDEL